MARSAGRAEELLSALSLHPELPPILVRTHAELAGWFTQQVGFVHVLDISDGRDGVLRAATRTTRQNVRVAERPETGIEAKVLSTRSEFMGPHLALVARSRSRACPQAAPLGSRIGTCRSGASTTVVSTAGALQRRARCSCSARQRGGQVQRSGSDPAAAPELPGLATAIDHLHAKGIRSLDFGVTDIRNETLREYKRRWESEEQPAHFSATHPRLLPDSLEPGRLLTRAVQRTPSVVGRTISSLSYPFAV